MKRQESVGMWIRLMLLAVLLIAISSAATLAQEPTPPQPEESATLAPPPQPGIPRHRPGRLAKVEDLDLLLAQGQITDPLSGNSTLVTWDKIALIWEDAAGLGITTKSYDVTATLGNPIAKDRFQPPRGVDGAGQMDIAAGHLSDESGWVPTVAAWEQPKGKIRMYSLAYDADLHIHWSLPWDIGEQVAGGYTNPTNVGQDVFGAFIRLATGDFDADGFDEIVMAWKGPNQSLNLEVYDTHGGFVPTPVGKISDESLAGGKFLDMATGDLNGDGDAEIAVAWEGQGLSVKVYDVDRDGNLTAEDKLDKQATPGQLALATGDFNGDRVDEIAVGYNTQTEAHLSLYQYHYDDKVKDYVLTLKGTASQPSGSARSGDELARVVGVGAGDFNVDGIDEIAFVYGKSGDGICYVQVYAADASLKLTPKARVQDHWLTAYGLLSLTVGDMNRDLFDEIVAVKPYQTDIDAHGQLIVGIFAVDPNLEAVTQKGGVGDDNVSNRGYSQRHAAVAVGGFDGKNVRVGPPSYSRLVNTKQVLAVSNAPPKHGDIVDGETIDVNVTDRCQAPVGPPCTYAKYETEQRTSTSMSLTTSRDWAVSEKAKVDYGVIAGSLQATYGQGFEKSTSTFRSMEFGQDVEADQDDAIVRIEQTPDVWEYPVYGDGSDAVQGYILVTWPEKADPTCSVNCAAAITAVIDGKDPASFYRPNHEFGNALSYSSQVPSDIDTTIKSDAMRYLGVNPYQMWVTWEDVKEGELKKSSQMDLKASLKTSALGQSLEETGEYSQGEVSVNKVGFESSTSIHLYLDGIEQKYSYGVRPFFYWAKPDRRLVLDYVVTPATASPGQPPTWWQTTYDKPDPAFNLPWKHGELGPEYELTSREITFDPPSPKAGEEVAITAKVRNYSLLGVNNVPVRFFVGDPDTEAATLIDETTVAVLNPLSSAETLVQFDTTGYTGQEVPIYVLIDPEGTIEEVHKDNNKAYALLPVKPLASPVAPATLSITADDIAFSPETPAAGEVVQILATIHAGGDTFTHAAVEFWDGDPKRGGRFIGGREIPMILAGQTGTADIGWDTAGLRGRRDIWVVIHKHPDEHVSTDNRAHRILDLEPHRLYLPAVMKD